MKNFIKKSLIIGLTIIVVYNFTLKEPVNKITEVLSLIDSSIERKKIRNMLRKSIRDEIKAGISKERIFYDEDRILIKKFIEKIILELNLDFN